MFFSAMALMASVQAGPPQSSSMWCVVHYTEAGGRKAAEFSMMFSGDIARDAKTKAAAMLAWFGTRPVAAGTTARSAECAANTRPNGFQLERNEAARALEKTGVYVRIGDWRG